MLPLQEQTESYDYPASTEPALVLNEDMSSQYYGLRQYSSDTICYPIYDYVFAVKQVDLGSENIAVALQRKAAGINVTLKNEDSSSLATSIDSVRVYVGNLAEKVNVYNGNYENYTKTVMIPFNNFWNAGCQQNCNGIAFRCTSLFQGRN